ncbi:MAG: CDP-glucose 4,6-dehydratase [Holophagaceae bacterium]|nr:CDP-glucose 4,6-dehydratase [Holophagaceae bacterium]
MSGAMWRGTRVFLTGHTGFKGGWLALWLESLGAKVYGYALPPPTDPSLFEAVRLERKLSGHTLADLADRQALERAIQAARPEVVFHLAAQPLVRQAYAQPVETYLTNVMGTVHLLEAVRQCPSVRTVVNVTTDKCYENQGWAWGYRETDALGGLDPYASSKACAELITAAFRRSYLAAGGLGVATARAGNVIGGGDWAADRLVPDALRALDAGVPLEVRAPDSVRPWQHVLEPLSGYLSLAEHLHRDPKGHGEAWNFGPAEGDAHPVSWLLDQLRVFEPGLHWRRVPDSGPHEAAFLRLDSSQARQRLGWRPRWDLARALQLTAEWHRAWKEGRDMTEMSLAQIEAYGKP